jgi:hypothetical protein
MPHVWTAGSVCECLIQAFKARPALPVHSAWRSAPVLTIGDVDVELNWGARFLQQDPDGWTFLKAWAQCKAARESVERKRVGMGWSRKAFQNGWRRAAGTVARELNAERINRAALQAGEAAEGRLIRAGRIEIADATPQLYRLTRGKPPLDQSGTSEG